MHKRKHIPFLLLSLLCACSTSGDGMLGSAADSALGVVGLKRASAEAPAAPMNVPIRFHASRDLNTEPGGKGFALVVRIYSLRDPVAFEAAPMDALSSPARERETLGADLMSVRELVLTPAQQIDIKESLAGEASYLAVAAMFRHPAGNRWKVVFPRGGDTRKGLIIGAHACALTVTLGTPRGVPGRFASLAGTVCGAPDERANDVLQ